MAYGNIHILSLVVALVMTVLMLVFALFGVSTIMQAVDASCPQTIEGVVLSVRNGKAKIETATGIVLMPVEKLRVPVEPGYYIKVEVNEYHGK